MKRTQEHGCGKVCYTRQEARRVVRAMRGKGMKRSYNCPICKNAWHVTRNCIDGKK